MADLKCYLEIYLVLKKYNKQSLDIVQNNQL